MGLPISHISPFTPLNVVGLILASMGFSVIATWISNHTRGNVLIAILLHAGSTAALSLGGQLLPSEMPAWVHAFVYASGLAVIVYGVCAALLVLLTRGQLGYRRG